MEAARFSTFLIYQEIYDCIDQRHERFESFTKQDLEDAKKQFTCIGEREGGTKFTKSLILGESEQSLLETMHFTSSLND